MTGGYTMKEKNIRELAKRMGLITVENMCQYTIAQLVVMVANKVNELVDEVWRFETDVQEILKTQNENIQYLLGEGLHLEVENIFDGWVQDGTFDTLLNQTVLKKVNDRIDETNAQLSEIQLDVSDNYTYLTQQLNAKANESEVYKKSEKIKMSDLSQDVKESMTGGSVAVVGSNSISRDNLQDNEVIYSKVTPLNKSAIINTGGEFIDFDFDNNIIRFPSGGVRCGKKVYAFNSHHVDYTGELDGDYQSMNLFFNTSTSAFNVKNNTNMGEANENEILVGSFQRDTKNITLPAPTSVKGIQPGYIRPSAVTPHINTSNKTPFTFNIDDNLLEIPSGAVRLNNQTFNFSKQTLALGDLPNATTDTIGIYFNTVSKTFEGYTTNTSAIPSTSTLVGTVSIAGRYANLFFDCEVVSTKTTNMKRYTNFGICGALNDYINFDFNHRKIVIPKTTNIFSDKGYFDSQSTTGGVDICLDMPSNVSEQSLTFNVRTKKFKIHSTTSFKNELQDDELIIAFFSINFNKVFMIGDYKLNGRLIKEDSPKDSVADYMMDDINEVSKRIKANSNGLTFGYITDSHNMSDHHKGIVEMSKNGVMEFILHGGDILEGETNYESVLTFFETYQKEFYESKVPVYICRGNHDSDSGSTISQEEWFNYLSRPFKKNDRVSNINETSKGYYYVDFEDYKFRLVVTNSTMLGLGDATDTHKRWGFNKEQLEWLLNEALDFTDKHTPSDWTTLVVGHHNTNQRYSFTTKAVNGEVLEQILKSFKEGSNFSDSTLNINHDFTQQGQMNLIGYLFGHCHYDVLDLRSDLGYHMIATTCSLPQYINPTPNEFCKSWERAKGTNQEYAWDIINIDFVNRLVKMYRVGAGVDREFNY